MTQTSPLQTQSSCTCPLRVIDAVLRDVSHRALALVVFTLVARGVLGWMDRWPDAMGYLVAAAFGLADLALVCSLGSLLLERHVHADISDSRRNLIVSAVMAVVTGIWLIVA